MPDAIPQNQRFWATEAVRRRWCVDSDHRRMQLTEPVGLFSPRQPFAYLNIFVATIYDRRQRKFGPDGFRVGNQLRYRKSESTP